MATERSRDSAWKAVGRKRSETAQRLREPLPRDLLTEELVREIFEAEWSAQFEDDRGLVQNKIKQIVNDSLDERKLSEGRR